MFSMLYFLAGLALGAFIAKNGEKKLHDRLIKLRDVYVDLKLKYNYSLFKRIDQEHIYYATEVDLKRDTIKQFNDTYLS